MSVNNKTITSLTVYAISLILVILITFKLISVSSAKHKPTAQLSSPITLNELDIIYGQESSKQDLFLFFNYNCMHCQAFFNEAFDTVKKEFIDQGKIRLILKPLEVEQHPDVLYALQTAVCINRFGSFNELHELLLYNPMVVYSDEFKNLVDDFINSNAHLAECLLDNNDYSYLKNNILDFYKNNMTATPTFVINNNIYKGFKDTQTLIKIIRKELKNTTQ